MPGPNFGWLDEANPLGPPADPDNNTPLSAATLEAFRAFLESLMETYANGKVASDVNLGGATPSSSVAPTQSAVQTYVANHSGSGSGATGYVNVQDPSTSDGAAVLAGLGGTTNLSTSLQNIINSAAGVSSVYFPPGVYGVNATLTVPSNTHLQFARGAEIRAIGAGFSVLLGNANTTTGNDNIRVEGGDFNGAGIVGNAVVVFLSTIGNRCNNLTIRDNTVRGGSQAGLGSGGLKVSRGAQVMLLNNRVHSNGGDGIDVWNGNEDVLVQGNHTYDNGDDDIAIAGPLQPGETTWPSRVVIADNICGWLGGETGSGGGITVRGAENVTVTGNSINSPWGVGIHVAASWQGLPGIPCRDIVVVGNVVTNAGQFSDGTHGEGVGIKVSNLAGSDQDVRNVTIQSNTVSNSRGRGLVVDTHSDAPNGVIDCDISHNRVMWDSARKSWVQTGVAGIEIDHSNGGLLVDSHMTNNKVIHPPGVGIDLGGQAHGQGTQRLKFLNNTVRRGTAGAFIGIDLDKCLDLTATGNSAYNTVTLGGQTYGISAMNCTGSLILCQNDCTWGQGNDTAPIVHDKATLAFLRLADNPGYAIDSKN